eukprot:scaffold1232_cov127-Isochrysis_galbana.AAC.4
MHRVSARSDTMCARVRHTRGSAPCVTDRSGRLDRMAKCRHVVPARRLTLNKWTRTSASVGSLSRHP